VGGVEDWIIFSLGALDSEIHDLHTYKCTNMHTYTHTYIHTYIRTYLHTHVHDCMHVYTTHTRTHTRTYARTHTHTHMHTHTHTIVCVCVCVCVCVHTRLTEKERRQVERMFAHNPYVGRVTRGEPSLSFKKEWTATSQKDKGKCYKRDKDADR